MATWIDHPLGLGNNDGEFSTMYGTPIKPVLSPTMTTKNHSREKPKDKGLIVTAIRLLKVRRVRYVMLGTGLGLCFYIATLNTSILSTSLRTVAEDFQGGGEGAGGFF